MTLLEVTALETGFGSNQILHGVTFSLRAGRTGVLLGLNGAGKSVTLKTISGLQPAWSGSITLDGNELTKLEAEDRIRAGLGHVLQSKAVFPDLTVAENLRLGGALIKGRAAYKQSLERVLTIYPRLAERLRQLAGSLSGGEQAMLAVGRALMKQPRLLLVDEPSAGLSPKMVGMLGDTLRTARDAGTTMLMVEQNVGFGLELADDVFVMEKGQVVYRHEAAELDRDRVAALLGIGGLLAEDEAVPEPQATRPLRTRNGSRATSSRKPQRKKQAAKKPAAAKPISPNKKGSSV